MPINDNRYRRLQPYPYGRTAKLRCINASDHPASLQEGALYTVIPDPHAPEGMIRVVDESGESYLYSATRFEDPSAEGAVEKV